MARDGIHPWSTWLRRYRAERDLTQEELGAFLDVDGKAVSAWENGQRPGRRHARTICARLGTTRAELGLMELDSGPIVDRRDFMRLSASLGSAALLGPWAGSGTGGAPAAEGFEAANDMLERLWQRAGPAVALGPALGQVESVTHLLQGSLPAAARPRLWGVLAEGAALLATCKGWMGDAAAGDQLAALATGAAREAGDPDLGVRVIVGLTVGDRRLRDRPDVVLRRTVEGEAGFDVAAAAAPTRAWAAARAAEAHAGLGHAEASLRALDEAGGLLAGGPGRRYPWPDQAWLLGERGLCLALLGRAAEARPALEAALAATGEERALDRLRWLLASARAHAGERGDRAARLALDVLRTARGMRHGQAEDEVARLRPSLTRPGPALRALDSALSAG